MDRRRERERRKKEEREREGGREGRKEGGGGKEERGRAPQAQCLGIPPGIPPPPQLTWCGFEQLLLPLGHNTIGPLTVQVHMCMYRCGCARALPGTNFPWAVYAHNHNPVRKVYTCILYTQKQLVKKCTPDV